MRRRRRSPGRRSSTKRGSWRRLRQRRIPAWRRRARRGLSATPRHRRQRRVAACCCWGPCCCWRGRRDRLVADPFALVGRERARRARRSAGPEVVQGGLDPAGRAGNVPDEKRPRHSRGRARIRRVAEEDKEPLELRLGRTRDPAGGVRHGSWHVGDTPRPTEVVGRRSSALEGRAGKQKAQGRTNNSS